MPARHVPIAPRWTRRRAIGPSATRPASIRDPARPGARERNPRGQGGRLRDDILTAATDLLDESGTEESVTLRAVARRARMLGLRSHVFIPDVVSPAAIDAIRSEVDLYRTCPVPRDDLVMSVERNLEALLLGIAERRGPTPDEVEIRAALGSRRAHQGLPVDALLQQAVRAYDDSARAEALLWQARRMNPAQLEADVALYKLYFYKLRLEEAEAVARDALDTAAGQGGFDTDWKNTQSYSTTRDVRPIALRRWFSPALPFSDVSGYVNTKIEEESLQVTVKMVNIDES